jgi:serine protease Do
MSRRNLTVFTLAALAAGGLSVKALWPTARAATPPPPAMDRTVGTLPSLAPLVKAVKGAVVNVDVRAHVKNAGMPMGMDPFSQFFGLPPGARGHQFRMPDQIQEGKGSGFIIESDGRILTNNHVVANAEQVTVTLDDGRTFAAKVLGRDPATDLALIQVKDKVDSLPVVALGNSDAMEVGDWVVAIGNPFGLSSSVSAGILSATARDIHSGPYDDFLQTDAAINPGNSGGPLFNLKGEVIGINTAIISGGTGIGFAVPSNMASAMLGQLAGGDIRRGWLGVGIQDLTPQLAKALNVPVSHGALVAQVFDGPAKRAGIRAEDVIVSMNGKPLDSSKALTRGIGFQAPDSTATLGVYRNGTQKDFKVQLGTRPENPGAATESGQGNSQEGNASQVLGLTFEDSEHGPVVTQVDPGSAAEAAGILPGMIIVQAGNHRVRTANDLFKALKAAPHGGTMLIRVATESGDQVLRALTIP